MKVNVEIFDAKTNKFLHKLLEINDFDNIADIKAYIWEKDKKLFPDRQVLRVEPRGRNLSDNETISSLNLPPAAAQLYLRDLGPQVTWQMVFLWEYFGPPMIYSLFYCRAMFIYGDVKAMPTVMHLAFACYVGHFVKRIYETMYVHRFSHATMPLRNLYKNCAYYWLFAVFIAYYCNHPLYTEPYFGNLQIGIGLVGFLLSEIGNYSVHVALSDLRPPGTKERKIPMPTKNPFTKLFYFVSCPNYSYEFYAWAFFSLMTQSLPALIFTLAGFYQMSVWALGKHRAYKKEFPNYPKRRKAIIPFLL